MAQDGFVKVGALKLHYLDYGGDRKPWLVCIHGLTGNAHSFDALAPELVGNYHALSLDVRGRGESDWGPPTDYLPQHYVKDLAGLLDALKIQRCTLVGTSMGGVISMMYAGGWPERVERMVLNDIGPEIDPAGGARIAGYVGVAPEKFANLDDVAEYYRENYPAMANMAPEQLREAVRWSVKPGPDGALVWKMDPAIRRPLRGGTAHQRLDLWVPFARITCPILVIRGATSDILSELTASQMRTTHQGVKVVEVPGVGHAPSLVEPESLAALRDFLSL
jgi:pimeloyl-ACP methyl ester carboxylesterase